MADGIIIVMSSKVKMAASLNLKNVELKRHWSETNPRLRKRFKITYLKKDLFPEYIRNSQNTINRK